MSEATNYAVFLFPSAIEALGEAVKPYLRDGPGGPHIVCAEIDSSGPLFGMTLSGKGPAGRVLELDIMLPVAMIKLVMSISFRRVLRPCAVAQHLEWPVARLVIHLRVTCDPEAEIKVRQPVFASDADLAEDRVSAEATCVLVGIEKRIDGRKTRFAEVGDGETDEAPVRTKLDEARRTPGGVQEAREIFWPRIVHAARGVA
jgi:hypothetical protein